ncbi:hypothetical protein, partial [Lysobacter sp. 1R34A]|uniref:hypothetical protein n=1 Tax=Lysobacter sp. 1R34A TaxID=3445786 RepID=UPI003EEB8B32
MSPPRIENAKVLPATSPRDWLSLAQRIARRSLAACALLLLVAAPLQAEPLTPLRSASLPALDTS